MNKQNKDIYTMIYNQAQISLINNILSSEFKNYMELVIILKTWKTKAQKENTKLDKKYEVLN